MTREVVTDPEGTSVEVMTIAPWGMIVALEAADGYVEVAPEADDGVKLWLVEIGIEVVSEADV